MAVSDKVYGTLGNMPTHPALESRAVTEWLPDFNGIPYVTWGLFVVFLVSTVMLALMADQWLFGKAKAIIP